MGAVSEHGHLEVKTVSLDELFAQGEIPKPHIIKMDIEGGEHRALLGAKNLLASARPTIFLATHGPEVHRQCCELLQSLGYRLSALSGVDVGNTDELICVA